jgi:GH15 family glucan-1,4-alpha-glucosidase
MGYQPIENYGVIGNMRSIALVGMNGSIDFLCYPNFDSSTVFAALLDSEKGGAFLLQPEIDGEQHSRQLYLPQTNILLTRFLSENGVAELMDFMPITSEGSKANEIIRTVIVVKGDIQFRLRCTPHFDYGRSGHDLHVEKTRAIFTPHEKACLPMGLYASIHLEQEGDGVIARFRLKAGEQATFVFGDVKPGREAPREERVRERFQETRDFWTNWISQSNYKGRWREMVTRSALMLKLFISEEYGSLIAAPTFSLPEEIGGVRNWDYRYTWIRDASFTLYALIRLGFVEESERFIAWIKERLAFDAEHGPLQVMYTISGGLQLDEVILGNLQGYKCSNPVRIGNAACRQLQLDIYGEMMDSIYLSNKYGDAISHEDWQDVRRILAWLQDNWRRPDDGIWEVRGGRREFLHSRVMCWVAFDRAIRLTEKRSLSAPLMDWYNTRDAIRHDIFTNFWNDKGKYFVQYKGSEEVDASILLMPMMRFISPVDPMWLSTLDAIGKRLVEDTLVYRYDTARNRVDGLPGHEGSFTTCSFWYIECLARSGELEKAQLLFEKMLGYANHLGLYSEELGSSGQHLGNFPQALTHLALISTATYLDRALSGEIKRTAWR